MEMINDSFNSILGAHVATQHEDPFGEGASSFPFNGQYFKDN